MWGSCPVAPANKIKAMVPTYTNLVLNESDALISNKVTFYWYGNSNQFAENTCHFISLINQLEVSSFHWFFFFWGLWVVMRSAQENNLCSHKTHSSYRLTRTRITWTIWKLVGQVETLLISNFCEILFRYELSGKNCMLSKERRY